MCDSSNVLLYVQPRRRTNKRAKSVAAQIEQTKEGTIDLSPNSFLGKINLKVSHGVPLVAVVRTVSWPSHFTVTHFSLQTSMLATHN